MTHFSFSKSEKPKLIDWLLLTIIILMSFFLFSQYGDIIITAKHSMLLIDETVKGRFFHYYNDIYQAAIAAHGSQGVVESPYYSIIIYMTFAIWSLPLWLFSHFSHLEIPDFTLMMWDKLLILMVVLITTYVLYRISILLSMNRGKAKWVAFLFLSSPILLFGSIVFTQYDIFSCFFTLVALYYFFEKKPYEFSAFMALAICYKNFSAFIFLPLVLLMEKRVLHICKYYLIGFSLVVVHKLIFSQDPGYRATQKALTKLYGFVSGVTGTGLTSVFGTIFFLGIAMVLACIFAYAKDIEKDEDLVQYGLYIPLFVYGIFFAFMGWHPQWVLILVPYIVFCAVQHKNFKLSLFVDIALSVSYLFVSFDTYTNNVDQAMVNYGILPKLFGVTYDSSLKLVDLVNRSGIPLNAFITIFSSCIFAMLILFFPKIKAERNETETLSVSFVPDRSVIWIRTLSILTYMAPALALYFYHLFKIR